MQGLNGNLPQDDCIGKSNVRTVKYFLNTKIKKPNDITDILQFFLNNWPYENIP